MINRRECTFCIFDSMQLCCNLSVSFSEVVKVVCPDSIQ